MLKVITRKQDTGKEETKKRNTVIPGFPSKAHAEIKREPDTVPRDCNPILRRQRGGRMNGCKLEASCDSIESSGSARAHSEILPSKIDFKKSEIATYRTNVINLSGLLSKFVAVWNYRTVCCVTGKSGARLNH